MSCFWERLVRWRFVGSGGLRRKVWRSLVMAALATSSSLGTGVVPRKSSLMANFM